MVMESTYFYTNCRRKLKPALASNIATMLSFDDALLSMNNFLCNPKNNSALHTQTEKKYISSLADVIVSCLETRVGKTKPKLFSLDDE